LGDLVIEARGIVQRRQFRKRVRLVPEEERPHNPQQQNSQSEADLLVPMHEEPLDKNQSASCPRRGENPLSRLGSVPQREWVKKKRPAVRKELDPGAEASLFRIPGKNPAGSVIRGTAISRFSSRSAGRSTAAGSPSAWDRVRN